MIHAAVGFVPWWAFPVALGLGLGAAYLIDCGLRHFEGHR